MPSLPALLLRDQSVKKREFFSALGRTLPTTLEKAPEQRFGLLPQLPRLVVGEEDIAAVMGVRQPERVLVVELDGYVFSFPHAVVRRDAAVLVNERAPALAPPTPDALSLCVYRTQNARRCGYGCSCGHVQFSQVIDFYRQTRSGLVRRSRSGRSSSSARAVSTFSLI